MPIAHQLGHAALVDAGVGIAPMQHKPNAGLAGQPAEMGLEDADSKFRAMEMEAGAIAVTQPLQDRGSMSLKSAADPDRCPPPLPRGQRSTDPAVGSGMVGWSLSFRNRVL
jgi:hypothetical protein